MSLTRMSELKVGENVTLLKFEIVLYIMHNKTKPLNSVIAFWMIVKPERLRRLSVLRLV